MCVVYTMKIFLSSSLIITQDVVAICDTVWANVRGPPPPKLWGAEALFPWDGVVQDPVETRPSPYVLLTECGRSGSTRMELLRFNSKIHNAHACYHVTSTYDRWWVIK